MNSLVKRKMMFFGLIALATAIGLIVLFAIGWKITVEANFPDGFYNFSKRINMFNYHYDNSSMNLLLSGFVLLIVGFVTSAIVFIWKDEKIFATNLIISCWFSTLSLILIISGYMSIYNSLFLNKIAGNSYMIFTPSKAYMILAIIFSICGITINLICSVLLLLVKYKEKEYDVTYSKTLESGLEVTSKITLMANSKKNIKKIIDKENDSKNYKILNISKTGNRSTKKA